MWSTEANSFAKVYSNCCIALQRHPEYISSPRNQKIHEILDASIVITDPYSNIFVNSARSVPIDYLKKELTLYFKGSNSVEEFGEASAFWKKLSDDGQTVNSAYGYLLFKKLNKNGLTQWKWLIDTLSKDSDSRQALMYLGGADYQYENVRDFVCTTSYHFFIRDDRLNMIVNRRSQDIFFGMTFDIPWELILMQCALVELINIYPNLKLGWYSLHCGSMHLYERNFDIIKEMTDTTFEESSIVRIQESPILHSAITDNKNTTDEFINWLKNK